MGRQVGFFALESDLAIVLRAAAEDGFRAIDEYIESALPPLRPALDGRPSAALGRFFLVPPEPGDLRVASRRLPVRDLHALIS